MWKCGTFILLTLNILLLIAFYIINNGYSKKESLLTEKVNKLFYENISLQDNIILSKQGYCQLDPKCYYILKTEIAYICLRSKEKNIRLF
mgnify:CR=1 FL=1